MPIDEMMEWEQANKKAVGFTDEQKEVTPMGDLIKIETTIIDSLNKCKNAVEIIKTLEFMGKNFKRIAFGAERDDRMHYNLCAALSYVEQHGYDTKYII